MRVAGQKAMHMNVSMQKTTPSHVMREAFHIAADFSLKSDSANQALPQILSARQTMAEFFGFVRLR
jgi:hypothetical protein